MESKIIILNIGGHNSFNSLDGVVNGKKLKQQHI